MQIFHGSIDRVCINFSMGTDLLSNIHRFYKTLKLLKLGTKFRLFLNIMQIESLHSPIFIRTTKYQQNVC